MDMTIVAAAVLMLAQPPSSTAKPAAVNPCALMTKQDAATAVAEAVGEPKTVDPGPSAMPGVTVISCEYVSAARNSIQLTVWRPFGDSAGMFLQIYKAECMKKEQVPGIGDLACWNSKEHRELQVLEGGTLLTFEIHRNGNATEVLKTVAKTALMRLGNP
jgi:hypothetical protein